MTTFAVQYTYDHQADRRDAIRPEHRAYLRGLNDAGTLLASGPYSAPATRHDPQPRDAPVDGTATPSTGDDAPGALLLVRADSAEEVVAALDGDPFWTAGLIAGRAVRQWDPVIGPWAS